MESVFKCGLPSSFIMKKKILILACSVLVLSGLTSGISDTLSSGAPIGSTGAPDEQTCGKAGCHTGEQNAANINTGVGKLTVAHDIEPSGYIPGNVYNFTVSLQENNVTRFGYSFTALDENNKKAGRLLVLDSIRTQLLQGNLKYTGREYMTYRMVGTNPYSQNQGLWTFKWKAPDQDQGKVSFYVAGVSGNNDATDHGDLVYTYSASAESPASGLEKQLTNGQQMQVYPNPAHESICVCFDEKTFAPSGFSLLSLEGRLLLEMDKTAMTRDQRGFCMALPYLPNGEYLLVSRGAAQKAVKKIFISNEP